LILLIFVSTKESSVNLGGQFNIYLDERAISKFHDLLTKAKKKASLRKTVEMEDLYPYTRNSETPIYINCTRNEYQQCQRGSVYIDPWLKKTLAFQENIQRNLSLNEIQLPATHNSHISYADGLEMWQRDLTALVQFYDDKQIFHLTNQWVTLTDQLEMGIRGLELDIHYSFGKIRICHAGGLRNAYIDEVLETIGRYLNTTIRWDSETIGCFSPLDPPFERSLSEIRSWLDKNPSEVLLIYLDNKLHLKKWNLVQNLTKMISDEFGGDSSNIIYTTTIHRQRFEPLGRWPTLNEFLSMGKRIVFISRTNYGDELMQPYLFPRETSFEDRGTIQTNPCNNPRSRPPGTLFVRAFSSGLWYAWFHKENGYVNSSQISRHMACELTNYLGIEMTHPKLMEGFIWSWDIGEPKEGNNLCPAIWVSSGRWKMISCAGKQKIDKYPFACQSNSDPYHWILAESPSTCPRSFSFKAPLNAYQQKKLLDLANQHEAIWINRI